MEVDLFAQKSNFPRDTNSKLSNNPERTHQNIHHTRGPGSTCDRITKDGKPCA